MKIDTTKRISHRELESPVREFTDPFELTFRNDQTVEEILQIIQSKVIEKKSECFFITDKKNILLGMVTLTDILYTPPKTYLGDIIDPDVYKVYENESLEKGLKILSSQKILMIPVVNQENYFIGVLEIMPHEEPDLRSKKIHYKHLKEDIFQFIGFSIELRKYSSPWTEYRLRMPWLLCNLVGGLICAVISEFFQLTLVQYVILAFFIPLVLTLSESVSIQSMTLSLRFLHLRKVHWPQVLRRAFVEGKSTLMLGVTSALIISVFYFAWSVDIRPIIGIAISIVIAMMVSALFGALFPILLHVLHLDPKVAAGPVVLMMADIFTISIYLGLNTVILI